MPFRERLAANAECDKGQRREPVRRYRLPAILADSVIPTVHFFERMLDFGVPARQPVTDGEQPLLLKDDIRIITDMIRDASPGILLTDSKRADLIIDIAELARCLTKFRLQLSAK